jgi:hypothetical protein
MSGRVAGGINHEGYVRMRVDGRKYLAHRLAWLYMTGNWPVGEIDHIDRNRSNNKFSNLREASDAQNRANSKASNSLGVKGVYFTKNNKARPYAASITVGKAHKHLGYYNTIDDASAAYKRAACEHFGEFARA